MVDRTGWIVVIGCFVLLMVYPYWMQKEYPGYAHKSLFSSSSKKVVQKMGKEAPSEATPDLKPAAIPSPIKEAVDLPPANTISLQNDYIIATFTTHGGGLKDVTLKKHEAEGGKRVDMNEVSELPVLNLTGLDGDIDLVNYKISQSTANSVTFTHDLSNGVRLTRTYTLSGDYSIELDQTLDNLKSEAVHIPSYSLLVGLGEPIHFSLNERNYLSGSWFTTDDHYETHKINQFDDKHFIVWNAKGKISIESPSGAKIRWASAKSQFYAYILSSLTEPAQSVSVQKLTLNGHYWDDGKTLDVVQTRLNMPSLDLSAQQSVERKFSFYVGPKEDSRLKKLPFEQYRTMEFGWLDPLCSVMLTVMNFLYKWVHNYGVTIILLTVFIKAILWWPQSKANASMKRMQLLSPKLKEVQDKFKDEPQRMQEEMIKLYKDYGVNPFGGCLPLLFQMPIFIAFYYMLQSSVELRHASFLWISDLSQPDTLFHIPILGIPFNLMPLLMGCSMFWSMKITPQPEGSNNPNANMMYIMPFFMLFICYNFSSALSLYWTTQNLLSLAQMYYNLSQPIPKLEKVSQVLKKRKRGL